MNLYIRTNSIGNITIQLRGPLDYCNSIPLHKKLEELVQKNPSSLITLDLYHLEFVGSSGIRPFAESIKMINKKSNQIRLSNVNQEFTQVFKLFEVNMDEILVDEFGIESPQPLPPFSRRRKHGLHR